MNFLFLGSMLGLVTALTLSAHDLTHPAHQASLTPGEAKLLAAAPSLREVTKAAPSTAPTCRLSLEIMDAETHSRLPGLVRITRADGSLVVLEGLVNRGLKLRIAHPAKRVEQALGFTDRSDPVA